MGNMGKMGSSQSEPDVTQIKRQQDPSLGRSNRETVETKLALNELVVILGVKKNHERENLKEFLLILKDEVFGGKGAIIDDLVRGVEKIKNGNLLESAFGDFNRAIIREVGLQSKYWPLGCGKK